MSGVFMRGECLAPPLPLQEGVLQVIVPVAHVGVEDQGSGPNRTFME